jgi:hypothetical protein
MPKFAPKTHVLVPAKAPFKARYIAVGTDTGTGELMSLHQRLDGTYYWDLRRHLSTATAYFATRKGAVKVGRRNLTDNIEGLRAIPNWPPKVKMYRRMVKAGTKLPITEDAIEATAERFFYKRSGKSYRDAPDYIQREARQIVADVIEAINRGPKK